MQLQCASVCISHLLNCNNSLEGAEAENLLCLSLVKGVISKKQDIRCIISMDGSWGKS